MSFADSLKKMQERKQNEKQMAVQNEEMPRTDFATSRLIDFLAQTESRKDDAYHPSQLPYWCTRREVFRRMHVPQTDACLENTWVTPNLQARFDIGHALHWWYQNKYLGPMGVLMGDWKCQHCSHLQKECVMPEECSKCGDTALEYVEMSVNIPEYDIYGHCDGILNIDGDVYVMDLKTIDPDLFTNIKKPYDSQTLQLRLYMHALCIQKGLIIFIDKSGRGDTPIKEFLVEQDEEILQEVFNNIDEARDYLRRKVLPQRCNCKTKRSKDAKRCVFAELCFDDEGREKAVKEWRNE